MTKPTLLELLEQRKYDPNRPAPVEQIVMRIEGKNIGSLQNFITVTGIQKSGKSRYIGAIAASAISRTEIFGISVRLPQDRPRVAYWDTEQSDFDFYRSMEAIKRLAGLDALPANFDAFNVREDDPRIIQHLVARYLADNPDVGLLLIDGLLDLLNAFNDEIASKKLINDFKRWTKKGNLLAVLVLHKGKSSATTLGHLGAMADRAAQSVLSVEKNKDRSSFILKADYLRSSDDFTPIEIYFNKSATTWEQTFYNPESDTKIKRLQLKPAEFDNDVHRQNLIRIFSADLTLQYKDLVQGIKEIYAVGVNWAKDAVPHLMKEGLLFKTDKGYTTHNQARLYIDTGK